MQTSDDIKEIAAALVEAQAKIEPVVKDGANPHFHSKYTSLSAIREAIRPVLEACGLAVVQSFDAAMVINGDGHERPTQACIGVTTTLLHKSGQWMRSTLPMPIEKKTPQGTGSAITYARRYALCAALGIVGDEDDDGNAAEGRKKEPPKPKAGGKKRATDDVNDLLDGL